METLSQENKEVSGKRFRVIGVFFAGFVVFPGIVLAGTFENAVNFFVLNIINPVVVLIIGLAVVYFLWGATKYILHADDAAKMAEGKDMMIYGIIAIFVMISMWGLVNLLDNTFGLDNNVLPRASDVIPSP